MKFPLSYRATEWSGSNGSLTGYAGGIDKKIKLLELEKAVPVLCNLSALSCEPPLTT